MARGFCAICGTFFYWRREGGPNISLAIGTVDPLYLFGEGADEYNTQKGEEEQEIPKGGFGRAIANCCGGHEWVANEIPGVTDELEVLGVGPKGRGERMAEE